MADSEKTPSAAKEQSPVKVPVSAPGSGLASTSKRLNVFYSWQSDLKGPANRWGIGNGLKAVGKALAPEIQLHIHEATSNTPGSPSIPDKILEKIRAADIFVADVTTITGVVRTKGAPEAEVEVDDDAQPYEYKGRPSPNPNVVFELGYAVHELGWDRIILMVNDKVSKVEDLPFDFDRHRVLVYRHDEKPTGAQKTELAGQLRNALDNIAKHDPPRPRDLAHETPEQVRRRRDIDNIRWALEQVHQPSLDDFVKDLPYKINDRVFFFHDGFESVVTNSLFHIHDPEMAKLFEDFGDGWGQALSGGAHFNLAANPHLYIWTGDRDPNGPATQARILAGAEKMETARQSILLKLRASWIEVDVRQTNQAAFDAYRANIADDEALLKTLAPPVPVKRGFWSWLRGLFGP